MTGDPPGVIECPECSGTGIVPPLVCHIYGVREGIRCPVCRGTGRTTKSHLVTLDEGVKLSRQ